MCMPSLGSKPHAAVAQQLAKPAVMQQAAKKPGGSSTQSGGGEQTDPDASATTPNNTLLTHPDFLSGMIGTFLGGSSLLGQ